MKNFLSENGQVLIISEDGQVAYKGSPSGYVVRDAVEVPDKESAILLFASDAWNPANGLNVARVDNSGLITWWARDVMGQLSADVIVQISLANEVLTANTWSGKRVVIDLSTGVATYVGFTK